VQCNICHTPRKVSHSRPLDRGSETSDILTISPKRAQLSEHHLTGTSSLARLHTSREESFVVNRAQINTSCHRSAWAICGSWSWSWGNRRRSRSWRGNPNATTGDIPIRCELINLILQPTSISILRDKRPTHTATCLLTQITAMCLIVSTHRTLQVVTTIVLAWAADASMALLWWSGHWRGGWAWARHRGRPIQRATDYIAIRSQWSNLVLEPAFISTCRDPCPSNATFTLLAHVAAFTFRACLPRGIFHVVPIIVHAWIAHAAIRRTTLMRRRRWHRSRAWSWARRSRWAGARDGTIISCSQFSIGNVHVPYKGMGMLTFHILWVS